MSSVAGQAVRVTRTRPRSVTWYRRKSVRRAFARTIATLIIAAGALIVLFPIAWMLSTSLKTDQETVAIPIQWIPKVLQWQNYPNALTALPFELFFRNTFIITILSVVGTVLSGSLVGFGFARLRAPGRDGLFLLVLATLILPSQVTVIPQFVLFQKLGWVNTFAPLIVPNYFGSAFNIFLLRQFFMTVPREMDEAAVIDGASWLQVWYRIMLPLSLPALGIIAIFQFIYSWNDFFGQLIYLNNNNVWTVALGLAGFTASYGGTAWNLLMAASLVAVLPCILLFFFAQRYFVQGIVISGVK
ncbi:MAG: carbohydrate ABC transporter permease [Chloroflexi bacterium]|nr:carbohydrate ABC transporter permease [Chloroflexota bacterium]